jgi:putative oxygen-independent coproporphyrinogen III oxidase
MNSILPSLSLYIHIPWCIQKCPYCDFNSHAVKGVLPEQRYVDILLQDLKQDLKQDLLLLDTPRSIHSIFIGGGTPSLFSVKALARLLEGIKQLITFEENVEITLEANPGTFESSKFAGFRQLGINRLSIGIQSFNDRHLKTLGRIHDTDEAKRAVEIAFKAGFDNINLDLMFGLPQQRTSEAINDVETAISLSPSHISFYQLTLEPNTYFYKFPPVLPNDENIFALQQDCQQLLAEQGYKQYEISAYAKKGKQCRHNLNYWQFGDYLGIGAGAHGKISRKLPVEIIRTSKCKRPEQYLQQLDYVSQAPIEPSQLPLEFMMNQLRLRQGFTLDHYQTVTGLDVHTLQPMLTECIRAGLLEQNQGHIRCSEKGWDFVDMILEKFLH